MKFSIINRDPRFSLLKHRYMRLVDVRHIEAYRRISRNGTYRQYGCYIHSALTLPFCHFYVINLTDVSRNLETWGCNFRCHKTCHFNDILIFTNMANQAELAISYKANS